MDLIKIPKIEDVVLLDKTSHRSSKQISGTLYITSSHLIFVQPDGKKEIWISHMHIASVDKLSSIPLGYPIKIKGKNFMNATFVVSKEMECVSAIQSLNLLSRPAKLEDLYAFTYRLSDHSSQSQGWDFFDLQSEYLRLGVPNQNWVLSNINKDYHLCSTYPNLLFVPITSSTPMLISSSKFRSKGRLPVLAYLHHFNQAVICRCSQPLVGFNARCEEDEGLFHCIGATNKDCKTVYVVDTRPKINALANRATGKGYESEASYQNVKFQFFNIENIHVMRASLNKLVEVLETSTNSMSAYLSGLESSGWLKHIKAIIEASVFVAKKVHTNTSVVVHCSDGWDRTSQVTSLASLLLDPHYRTIEGFQTLIEKDWLSFGHKFIDRCGFISSTDPKETSPIFTQFLDCIWQVMEQFPKSFEFNEKYLLSIHDHLFSSQFGTFLSNCAKEREYHKLNERTYSLWGYLLKYTRDFSNPFYDKHSSIEEPTILPVTNPQSIKLWKGLYCRFNSGSHSEEDVMDAVRLLKDHHESLTCHKALLLKRIKGLQELLGHDDDRIKNDLEALTTSNSIDFKTFFNSGNNQQNLDTNNSQKNLNNKQKNLDDNNNQNSSDNNVNQQTNNSQQNNQADNQSDTLADRYKETHNEVDGVVSTEQLLRELTCVAMEMKEARGVVGCSCAMPFEQHSFKNQCWSCGNIFCTRCIDRYTLLPGHLKGSKKSPVCKSCFKIICSSPQPSVDDFQKLIEKV